MRLGDNGLVALDPISGASSAKFVSTVSSLEELGVCVRVCACVYVCVCVCVSPPSSWVL